MDKESAKERQQSDFASQRRQTEDKNQGQHSDCDAADRHETAIIWPSNANELSQIDIKMGVTNCSAHFYFAKTD